MKNLIVLAHPNKESFNSSIADKIVSELKNKAEEVVLRDLYRLGFDPVYTWEEMGKQRNGHTRDDILKEQQLVKEADNLIFIYPIWWTSMPAILKGYFDRVFSYGFAYAFNEQGGVDSLLKGKSVSIINTHGTPKEYYDQSGMSESMKQTTDTGIFGFCGIEVKEHIFLGEIPYIDNKQGEEILQQIVNKIC